MPNIDDFDFCPKGKIIPQAEFDSNDFIQSFFVLDGKMNDDKDEKRKNFWILAFVNQKNQTTLVRIKKGIKQNDDFVKVFSVLMKVFLEEM